MGTSLRGSSVPTNTTRGRPGPNRSSIPARHAASDPGVGSSGRKRSVSTPCGATTTSACTVHQRPERVGGRPARAHHHGGVTGGPPDGPPEEDHLGAFVPLGGVEEAEIVDGDHRRDRGVPGHRVVRSVVDGGPRRWRAADPGAPVPRPAGAGAGPERRPGGCPGAPSVPSGPDPRSGRTTPGRRRDARPAGPPVGGCSARRRPAGPGTALTSRATRSGPSAHPAESAPHRRAPDPPPSRRRPVTGRLVPDCRGGDGRSTPRTARPPGPNRAG